MDLKITPYYNFLLPEWELVGERAQRTRTVEVECDSDPVDEVQQEDEDGGEGKQQDGGVVLDEIAGGLYGNIYNS